jgi:hypothetical protein
MRLNQKFGKHGIAVRLACVLPRYSKQKGNVNSPGNILRLGEENLLCRDNVGSEVTDNVRNARRTHSPIYAFAFMNVVSRNTKVHLFLPLQH